MGVFDQCKQAQGYSSLELSFFSFFEMIFFYQPLSQREPNGFTDRLVYFNTEEHKSPFSIHPSGPYSIQSIGAVEAVSWAIGHNPGGVATPTQDTRMAQSSQQAGTHFADLRRMTPTWY